MENNMTIEQLREEVNPVYNTAQSCLQIISMLGDKDSEELRKKLGFSVFGADADKKAKNVPPQVIEMLMRVLPSMTSAIEARFYGTNNYIERTGAKLVLDLPCGYTARGIKLAKSGIRYCGADLPAVTDAIAPAVKEFIGENANVSYTGADATNYASLRKALGDAEGELLITSEGLLMYLTQSELETLFGNVRKLLLEFGGRWITLDNELDDDVQDGIVSVLTDDLAPGEGLKIANIIAGAVSKTTMASSTFFDKEKAKKFVSDMGFDLELVPIKEYLPAEFASFKDLSEEKRAKAVKPLEELYFWVMTPKPGTAESFSCGSDDFKAEVKLNGEILNVSLAGRLDTITAPELLTLFREAEAKGSITSIVIDMKKLEYISSAGLRVLLMFRKSVKDDNAFTLIGLNDKVREIIETTGFDSIFC